MLTADERVRGVWLAGSLARGTADAASDLDLLVAVRDEDHETFAAAWRTWLGEITPTVLAEEQWFAKGSFWSITPNFERFDVVVEAASHVADTLFPQRVVVLDRNGLTSSLPPVAERGPSAAIVGKLVQDWFHFSAMIETVLWRQDWLLGTEHLHFLRDLLYKLYVESNQPMPAMGVKQWSTKLTAQQRSLLEELPAAVTSRESLVSAHLQYATAFLPPARLLATQLDLEWPVALQEAATEHLRQVLELSDPYPTELPGQLRCPEAPTQGL